MSVTILNVTEYDMMVRVNGRGKVRVRVKVRVRILNVTSMILAVKAAFPASHIEGSCPLVLRLGLGLGLGLGSR